MKTSQWWVLGIGFVIASLLIFSTSIFGDSRSAIPTISGILAIACFINAFLEKKK